MISISFDSIKYLVDKKLTKKKDQTFIFLVLQAFSMPMALQEAALL